MIYKTLLTITVAFLLTGCVASTQKKRFVSKSLDSKLDIIAKKIASSVIKDSKIKIAIMHFANQNRKVSAFDMYIADGLEKRFAKMKKFEPIERKMMYKIYNYEEMLPSGDLNSSELKDAGYMVDADVVVTGITADLGNEFDIKTKLRLVTTAKEIVKTSHSVGKNPKLTLLSNNILKIKINNRSKVLVDTKDINEVTLSPRTPMKKTIIVFKETKIRPTVKRIVVPRIK